MRNTAWSEAGQYFQRKFLVTLIDSAQFSAAQCLQEIPTFKKGNRLRDCDRRNPDQSHNPLIVEVFKKVAEFEIRRQLSIEPD